MSICLRSFLSAVRETYSGFVIVSRAAFRLLLPLDLRYRGNRCITKMKPFDSIGETGDSSAFGSRHTFFRFRSIPLPVETDHSDRYYFPVSPSLPLFLLLPPLSFTARDKLSFLAVSFVAPSRRGPEYGRDTLVASVYTGNGRRWAALVDRGVSHVL